MTPAISTVTTAPGAADAAKPASSAKVSCPPSTAERVRLSLLLCPERG